MKASKSLSLLAVRPSLEGLVCSIVELVATAEFAGSFD
jgi:hypothetical protein